MILASINNLTKKRIFSEATVTTKNVLLITIPIVIGIVLPLFKITTLLVTIDEFYFAICSESYAEQPVALLAFWCSNIVTYIFGDNILVLKYYSYFLYTLATAIGCLYFYHYSHKPLVSAWGFCCLQLCNSYFVYMHYGWWSLCYLLITITTILCLEYYKKPSFWKIFYISVMVSLVTQSRLPSICIICVIPILIFVTTQPNINKAKALILFITTIIVTNLLLIILICGSLTNFIELIQSKSFVSNHDSFWAIFGWLKTQPQEQISLSFMPLVFLSLVCLVCKIWKDKKPQVLALGILTTLVTIYIYITGYLTYYTHTNYIIGSFYFLVFFLPLYRYYKGTDWKRLLVISLIIFSCALSICIGSDQGLNGIVRISLIPILCTFYLTKEKVLIPAFLRKYLIMMGIVTFLIFPSKFIQWYGYRDTKAIDFNEKLDGLRVNHQEYFQIKEFNEYWENQTQPNQTLFLGCHRYMLYYIGCPKFCDTSDEKYLANICISSWLFLTLRKFKFPKR